MPKSGKVKKPVKNIKRVSKNKKNTTVMAIIGIFVALVIIGLIWLFYPKYVVWDAKNPNDDESLVNQILKPFTPSIDPKSAFEMINSDPNVVVLDVRAEGEFDQGYIPGATPVPEQILYDEAKWIVPNKNSIIYVYGFTTNKGAVAARLLRSMGYSNVFNIEGGLQNWQNTGLPINKKTS